MRTSRGLFMLVIAGVLGWGIDMNMAEYAKTLVQRTYLASQGQATQRLEKRDLDRTTIRLLSAIPRAREAGDRELAVSMLDRLVREGKAFREAVKEREARAEAGVPEPAVTPPPRPVEVTKTMTVTVAALASNGLFAGQRFVPVGEVFSATPHLQLLEVDVVSRAVTLRVGKRANHRLVLDEDGQLAVPYSVMEFRQQEVSNADET